jgi:DNA-binding transcriptional LysR family regulator
MQMLVCLEQERSLTAAAKRLHLTQQAVSAQVKRLELLTGRTLLARSAQEVRFTAAGEALLIYARQVVTIAERLRLQFSATPLEGAVRFGFTPGFGLPMLFPVLTQLRRVHPKLELYCETDRTDALIDKLEAGSLDVIIGAQRVGDRRGELLLRERMIWVGDGEQLVRPPAPIPLALLPHPTFLREHVFEILDAAGYTWTVFFESGEFNAMRAAMLSGWGMSIFNESLIAGDPELVGSSGCALLPDAGHVEFILRYEERRNSVSNSFAGVLRSVLGDLRNGPSATGSAAEPR